MPTEPPALELAHAPGEGWLRLSAGTVPGRIERVDLLDGARAVATTGIRPPQDGSAHDLDLALTPWDAVLARPTVVVYYRRDQPSVSAPSPLTRAAFRLLPHQIKDLTMTPEDRSGQPDLDERDLVSATFDFGTSRAVCAITNNRAIYMDRGTLPADGLARAVAVAHLSLDPDADQGLEIDRRTARRPQEGAAAWREVLGTPPLEVNHLQSTRVRSSDLIVADGRAEFADESVGTQQARRRGVKRYLVQLKEEVADTGMSGEKLFHQVYQRFIDLVAKEVGLGKDERISRVNITYPTKLPPDRRQELLAVVRDLAPRVEMTIDESAAAAGFFLLRRFGADSLLGVEAFKLHARCPEGPRAWEAPELWAKARQWHENLLVIDVGGGTTDCALVKAAIVDATPAEAGDSRGRFYRLQPEVLASGGRMHLGGDLLTLHIFQALKRKLNVPDEITKFEGLQGQEAEQRRAAFDALWRAAEEVKHQGLKKENARDVTVRVAGGQGQDAGPGGARRIEVGLPAQAAAEGTETVVTAAELTALMDNAVDQIAALAAGIAHGGLHTSAPAAAESAQSVDHVLFSGGSLLSGYLRRRIEESLRARFEEEGLDATFEVVFDPAYCKTGTALGGMYLNAVADFAVAPEDPLVCDQLVAGRSYFDVDSSNLRVNLAADFHIRQDTASVRREPVFRRGLHLYPDGSGNAYAESAAFPVSSKIEIHRYDVSFGQAHQSDGDTQWAASTRVSREEARRLREAGVQVRFEIDQEERVTMLLCKGVPGWRLEGRPQPLPAGLPALVDRTGPQDAPALAVSLYVDVYQPGIGVQRQKPLLAAGLPVPPGGLVRRVSGRTLYWRRPDEAWTPPGGAGAENARRPDFEVFMELPADALWLSVDQGGALRLHDQRPERPGVPDHMDLLTAPPGSVFQQVLSSGTRYEKTKDPFSGVH
ncbi:hypothetical protein Misp01_43190 [Microtetraspora sp. NBRC 13810]|uniref:hypothetical protein n=1 Tax=Microtetraspora sp. NBRC 13810 TaxID=3030990 RepID=UPI0024A31E47|nr:hypothetical protein [Microtetraspora sp. NBRC 13810]GLW09190.1 hypothetical protein Misp01_43190 [Microtetraspora sp. NBRC 13810]